MTSAPLPYRARPVGEAVRGVGELGHPPTVTAGTPGPPRPTPASRKRGTALPAPTLSTLRVEAAIEGPGLLALRDFLAEQRAFMLGLLENPTLLEHERFTDLLWAAFHLQEELCARQALEGLSEPDRAHLAVDFDRAYSALLIQWLEYLIHLRRDYPYLFSFAARTNPWRPDACPEIT